MKKLKHKIFITDKEELYIQQSTPFNSGKGFNEWEHQTVILDKKFINKIKKLI